MTDLFNIFKKQVDTKKVEVFKLAHKVQTSKNPDDFEADLHRASKSFLNLSETTYSAGFIDNIAKRDSLIPSGGTNFNTKKWAGRLRTHAENLQNDLRF